MKMGGSSRKNVKIFEKTKEILKTQENFKIFLTKLVGDGIFKLPKIPRLSTLPYQSRSQSNQFRMHSKSHLHSTITRSSQNVLILIIQILECQGWFNNKSISNIEFLNLTLNSFEKARNKFIRIPFLNLEFFVWKSWIF